ncbi:MAG TPA: hypothetical protein VFA60_11480 [Terriglobales bacterium]|nr:hypothetical protein [Terriglobales bacterium]
MLSKCANPGCSAKLRYLNQGKIFRVESDVQGFPARRRPMQRALAPIATVAPAPQPETVADLIRNGAPRAEYFWLCGPCAREMTVSVVGEQVVLMPVCAASAQAAAS